MYILRRLFLGALFALCLTGRAQAAAPVINLIRPTNGSSYAVGTPILVRAFATASNATLASLDFVAGTNVLRHFSGPLTNGIYGFSWSNAPAGIHQVHAEALDDTGAQGVSVSAQITVTNIGPFNVPIVNMTQPTNGSVFAAGPPIFLTASATDSDGTVSYVDFFTASTFLGRANGPSTNSLYNWMWTNAAPGMYQVHAEAVDNLGGRGISASVLVNVTGVTNVGCTFTLSPLARTHSSGVSTGTVSVTTGSNCVWGAYSTNVWITVLSPATNVGAGMVVYSVATNPGQIRTGSIRIDGQNFTVSQSCCAPTNPQPPACTYALSPSNALYAVEGGTGVVSVATQAGCLWNLFTSNAWIHIESSLSNAGNGTVSYLVEANPGQNRTGYLHIDGRTFSIGQAGVTNALPVVSWFLPTNGASFAAGSSILLRAIASDPDGNLRSIDFFNGTNLLQRLWAFTNGTYSLLWPNVPPGVYQVHAEAEDNLGARGVSASAQITVTSTNPPATNNVLPVVNWLRPANGTNLPFGAPIILTARATDSDGTISFVDFFAGSVNLGRVFGTPTNSIYNWVWSNAPAGTFQLRAAAVDNAGGLTISASVQIAVGGGTNSPPTNNVLPAVTWIRPTNGAALPAGPPIIMTARATDLDGTVDYVEFFANSLNLGHGRATTNGLYTFAWSNAPSGILQLHAEAVDNAGGRGVSPLVQIIVGGGTNSPPTNNALPVVTWIQPTNGSAFDAGRPILLTVRATDSNGIIDFVDFFAGSIYLGRGRGTPTNSLYSLTWSNPPAGTFPLHAEAVDNAGARGVSGSVLIVVGGGGNTMVDLGVVQVSSVGHTFATTNGMPVPGGRLSSVVDYLIDQDQNSGGGGVLPTVSVNWDTNTQFKLRVSAPAGMRFLVAVPAGRLVKFGGFLWWESSRGGFSTSGEVTATFADLEGTAPEFTQSDSVLSDSHGFFGFDNLESTGVSNSFAFTSIELTGIVAPQYTGNGTENYLPHLESSLRLNYSTTEANDPGRFVSIVPVGPLPAIQVISVSSETGVDLMIYGQAGRTHVVECSENAVTWIPISSAVMSAASAMPVRDASPTTVNSRFYRVIELP